jgi:DNA helicase-2/ATP-dependent DNA helicase PcrA
MTVDAALLPSYLEALNDAQREAVLCASGGQGPAQPGGPLLVIAGAGTGKTNTLAHRVAHLVAQGADPARILLLTFTTRAADEMTRRVARIVARARAQTSPLGAGAERAPISWAGTFHGIGARLLRELAPRVGLEPTFTIHNREDSADLVNLVRHELGYSAKEKRFPLKGTCLSVYSAVINTGAPLADVLRRSFPWCAQWEAELKTLFLSYVQAKQAQNVLDYDDLLLYWARMASDAALAGEIGARFDHILVDEYQDTNRLQSAILLGMKPDGRGVTVVGDDAQSIYAFRGATVRNILDFPAQFQPPARRVTLERNYRSGAAILGAANAVIALARERFTKDLWTERKGGQRPRLVSVRDDAGQAEFVVEQVLARRERGVALKSQAVLFRSAHHSARTEIELTRRGIPFVKYGGLKFLEATHVKDVLAVLRWAQNPRDRISGFRAVQLLPGVGPKTAGRLLDETASAGGAQALRRLVPSAAQPAWDELAALHEALARRDGAWPAPFEQACRWYEAQMERRFDDAAARAADIRQLARIAATYSSLERFLTSLTLDPPQATSDEAGVPTLDEDYLILSTIHSAKGQEWTAVTLLNLVDGCLPSDLSTGSSEEIEEERRLLYVAMTRARDELDLVVPLSFPVSGQPATGERHVYASRSRFVPAGLLRHFEQLSWPAAPAAGEPSPPGGKIVDLRAQVRAMWL